MSLHGTNGPVTWAGFTVMRGRYGARSCPLSYIEVTDRKLLIAAGRPPAFWSRSHHVATAAFTTQEPSQKAIFNSKVRADWFRLMLQTGAVVGESSGCEHLCLVICSLRFNTASHKGLLSNKFELFFWCSNRLLVGFNRFT